MEERKEFEGVNSIKFMPLYSLAKLYDKTEQKEKACMIAEEIVNKEVKVPSLKITRIKSEMHQLILKMAEENGLPPVTPEM